MNNDSQYSALDNTKTNRFRGAVAKATQYKAMARKARAQADEAEKAGRTKAAATARAKAANYESKAQKAIDSAND